jgi:hypothetical protein
MNSLGAYDVEYNGRQLLVEEADVGSLTNANIGLWTNVMEDGSTISIVGHAALIDDVAHMVA